MNSNSKFFNWGGCEWISQQPWGVSHQEHPNIIYSPECIVINKNDEVELTIKRKEDHILMGLLSSVKLFGYGTYTIDVEMPKGHNIWPALWLCRHQSWPPEIDIMEAYYNKKGNIEGFLNKRIESTLHYSDNGKGHKTLGGKLNFIQYNLIDWDKPMQYRLYWGKEHICVDIIQDAKKYNVFRTSRKNVVNKFYGDDWYFIMNLHPTKNNPHVIKPFIIKKFSYQRHE